MFATLTSKVRALALAVGLALAAGAAPAPAQVQFVSPEAALEQGVNAYRGGYYQQALPALEFAAGKGGVRAKFHLARLLADNATPFANHKRAYDLYLDIVREHAAQIDVDDDERAPYVGKAMTAVARYTYRGLADHVNANAALAAEYYQEAATFFRQQDAQFELAKLYLKGDGVPKDQRQAQIWLRGLSQDGHSGAQAFLADLLWTGKDIDKDQKTALALIDVAVLNASDSDRIWIEDIYQRIYCGAGQGVRKEAGDLVASYRRNFSPRVANELAEPKGAGPAPTRTCNNGEVLPRPQRESRAPQLIEQPQKATNAPSAIQSGVVGVRGR